MKIKDGELNDVCHLTGFPGALHRYRFADSIDQHVNDHNHAFFAILLLLLYVVAVAGAPSLPAAYKNDHSHQEILCCIPISAVLHRERSKLMGCS